MAPALDTVRLTLRAHTPADLAECAAMWADPLVVRHLGGRPFSEEETWARVLRYAGLWALVGYGYWVARERATGRLVGEVGFVDFRRELAPPLAPALAGAPEAGWVFASWAHGRGFATEAVRAALAWADAHLRDARGRARPVWCLVAPDNAASARVAERCGFREAGRTAYRGEDARVLARGPAGAPPAP